MRIVECLLRVVVVEETRGEWRNQPKGSTVNRKLFYMGILVAQEVRKIEVWREKVNKEME